MVLDSSAVIAMLADESGAGELADKVRAAQTVLIGAPVLFETAIVLNRSTGMAIRLADFLDKARAEVVPFGEQHYTVAFRAFLRFGKGRHPARLNILDCMAYATAFVARLPLLYVGDDFAKTDIEAA